MPGRPRGTAPAPPDERLAREHILRRSADYLKCYRRGRRLRGPHARLHYAPNELGHPRLGITASRKVGKAVVRNRLKRRVRETFRRWPGRRALPALDLVVHLEPAAAGTGFAELSEEIVGMLSRIAEREGR